MWCNCSYITFMTNNKILFFDSGIGGLTTLCQCIKLCPNQQYLYFADVDNMPYGQRSRKELKTLIQNKVSALVDKFLPCVVVLACNTATAVGIAKLREKYPSIIFIGTEPAVVPAIKTSKSVLLLATHNTLKFSKIVNLVGHYYKITKVCPNDLAQLIENNFDNPQLLKKYLKALLSPFKNKTDCVVLGCTHYVFCKELVKQIMGKDVLVLDGNEGIAKRLCYCLSLFNIPSTKQSVTFCNTKSEKQHLLRALNYFFGGEVCAE